MLRTEYAFEFRQLHYILNVKYKLYYSLVQHNDKIVWIRSQLVFVTATEHLIKTHVQYNLLKWNVSGYWQSNLNWTIVQKKNYNNYDLITIERIENFEILILCWLFTTSFNPTSYQGSSIGRKYLIKIGTHLNYNDYNWLFWDEKLTFSKPSFKVYLKYQT